MARALDLARAQRGQVWPNPPVGCVITNSSMIISEAATSPGGRPHAERLALDKAGSQAKGATLYVTLEPCCHWGKTPPCADAIIAAGIRRVVASVQDPDSRVNGGGFRRLRQAGVEVAVGLGADEAMQIMSGFLHRIRYGTPELILLDHRKTQRPDGVDALLTTRDGTPQLIMAPGRPALTLPQTATQALAEALGSQGLTSVALWRGDPLAKALTASAPAACHSAS